MNVPSISHEEVLVRVLACGINHYDLFLRKGDVTRDLSFPHVMGADVAGEIEDVGSQVQGLTKGDRVIVAPGETFSFNATLGDSVELHDGWKTSLGIFNGEDLEPTAGGGICQVSTTVYRAGVAAGLPIKEKRNHSIYVKYYREYGEGLDATIFLNSQDLIFENDTGNYILFYAYYVGDEAVVELYGTPDGRKVVLEGPFRRHDAPDDVLNPENTWGLGHNDIGWRQTIARADGTEEKNILLSRYRKEIPWNPPEEEYPLVLSPIGKL